MADHISQHAHSSSPTAVLIVGAGPTGLMLACELARHDVPFRIVEAASGPQKGSRGKGVQPRTLEVFDDLGIGARVISHGAMAMTVRSVGLDGQVRVGGQVPAGLLNRPDIPYPASVITPEWRTEEALRLRLAELGGRVEFGTALTSFEQSADVVTAVITSEDRSETVRAQWLVGCDGGHSLVRAQAGVQFVGETRENVRMIVADLAVDGLDRDAWHMWQHPDGLLALCPLPSTDVFQYQAVLPPGSHPELNLADIQAILENRTGRTDIRLHTPEWFSLWRANVRLVDRYQIGRVFLAGDAAHIHSPAGGQGMNTGIQDAYNLGWKIAAVSHGAPDTLLDTYESERRPVAAHVLALSDARLAQTLEHREVRRDASTIQLDVGYRGSVLAHDDRDGDSVLRAGDRAPDATALMTTGGMCRLFDLVGGAQFTLLDFSGRSTAVPPAGVRLLRVVDHPSDTDEIADTAAHLVTAYGATERSLVLIRPDGYIALISDGGDRTKVTDYLESIRGVTSAARG